MFPPLLHSRQITGRLREGEDPRQLNQITMFQLAQQSDVLQLAKPALDSLAFGGEHRFVREHFVLCGMRMNVINLN
jgi:hypothetical protein